MKKLKSYLARSNIKQAAFAASIGVSQPTVSDWLNGATRPSIDNLIAIARETHLSIDELVRDLEEAAA